MNFFMTQTGCGAGPGVLNTVHVYTGLYTLLYRCKGTACCARPLVVAVVIYFGARLAFGAVILGPMIVGARMAPLVRGL